MSSRLAILFLFAPCAAFLAPKGAPLDSKKAKQLVISVFSEENKTKLKEVEKNILNGTDQVVFLKQYHAGDMQEISEAGLLAEKYNEVSFDALSEMLKATEPSKATAQLVAAAAAAAGAKQAQPAAETKKFQPHHHRGSPPRHPKKPATQTPEVAQTSTSPTKTFIDLGSGVGRAVLFACASGEFQTCEGVELSETRHKMALDALSKFKHLAPAASKKVTFINGNLLDNDAYYKKDVMLLDNDFMTDGLMENFVRKFEHVSPRGTVLLTTKKIPQISRRVATRTRMAVEGEKGHRQFFFKYTRT